MIHKAKNISSRFLVGILILAACLLISCNRRIATSPDALDSDTSYAFGMFMANTLAGMGLMDLSFDYEAFTRGFRDFNEALETRLTPDRAMELINLAVNRLQAQQDERQWLEAERNRAEGEAYMAQNSTRSGVVTTASGLQYEVITQGTGRRPGPTDVVRVHYEGTLIDGTVFDSSFARGQPLEFGLAQVIAGWTEGLQLMNEGSAFRFVIPPDLGYGPHPVGIIPANSTLIFHVELIAVVD